jgi:hypothetical protein
MFPHVSSLCPALLSFCSRPTLLRLLLRTLAFFPTPFLHALPPPPRSFLLIYLLRVLQCTPASASVRVLPFQSPASAFPRAYRISSRLPSLSLPQLSSTIPSHLQSPALTVFLFPSIYLYSPTLRSARSLSSLPSRLSVNNPRVECTMTRCYEWDSSRSFCVEDLLRDVCKSDLRRIQTQWRMVCLSFRWEMRAGLVRRRRPFNSGLG